MKTDKPIMVLVDEFISELDRAEVTKRLYIKTLGYFVKWITINVKNVRDIKKADLLTYKGFLKSEGKSNSTIDNYLCSVRKWFFWLNENDFIETNIAETISWERDRRGTFLKLALTTDQISALLDRQDPNTAVGSRNYALIDLMTFTGLRCREVTSLNIGDIKHAADNWTISIQRKGSREKSGLIHVPYERIKPIQDSWIFRSILTVDQPVFVNYSYRSMQTRMTPTGLSRILKDNLRKIGLTSNQYSAHSLRHTAATLAFYAGSETWEIGRMLGHRNPRQTEWYIHALGFESADQGKATSKIEDYVKNHIKTRKNEIKTEDKELLNP
jgi:site-specific recombinase XerD